MLEIEKDTIQNVPTILHVTFQAVTRIIWMRGLYQALEAAQLVQRKAPYVKTYVKILRSDPNGSRIKKIL